MVTFDAVQLLCCKKCSARRRDLPCFLDALASGTAFLHQKSSAALLLKVQQSNVTLSASFSQAHRNFGVRAGINGSACLSYLRCSQDKFADNATGK